jgi:hypothetical protein
MKTFKGTRDVDGLPRVTVCEHNRTRALAPRLDISQLPSPDFDWATRDTASLCLTVAILADAIGGANGAGPKSDWLAKRVAFHFLDDVTTRLPYERFELTEIEVLKAVDAIQREQGSGMALKVPDSGVGVE